MKCSACKARLARYREGDLSAAAASAVRDHLERCQGCQAFLAELSALEARLARVREIEPRSDFTQLVMARIAALPSPARAGQRSRLWWLGMYDVVAWVLLAALAATGILHWQAIVGEGGLLAGRLALAGADLYRIAGHFHLGVYAAAGVLIESLAAIAIAIAARRTLRNVGNNLLGARAI
ncbi:MAG: hypothetical protein DLM53_10685 [Candidatus Eremiobacter antarcticus]|nr:hypothetical protein [Candidatus Eremiobacteraeota bacterium]PZR60816.1 MAG: hypothetical protein DLM53_10685 [Candidatus Eremiobacter sp. RRmetagenome_bin22]